MARDVPLWFVTILSFALFSIIDLDASQWGSIRL